MMLCCVNVACCLYYITQTWSRYLVYHFASPGSEGSGISGLLQLLLSLTASPGVAGSAAAALRTVVTSASKTGWHKLHMLAPLLMEVGRSAESHGLALADLLIHSSTWWRCLQY